jgi:hypothetical protein
VEESDVPVAAVQQVVALAEESIVRHGVRLSIENSGGLGFRSMGLLLSLARQQLPLGCAKELGVLARSLAGWLACLLYICVVLTLPHACDL